MTQQALSLLYDGLGAVGNLEAYLSQVRTFPWLSETEEQELAVRWHTQGDVQAARALILSHLRYVVKLVRGYRGYGLPEADLIQEGNIGLMKAVKRFDPSLGVRLAAFAVYWIKAEIHDFVIKNFRLIKMATTKAQKKLFFNLNKLRQGAGSLSVAERQAIANSLSVSVQDVEYMETRFSQSDLSLDHTPSEDATDGPSWANWQQLPAPDSDPSQQCAEAQWSERRLASLTHGLAQLPSREQDIIRERWLGSQKRTLHDLAKKWQVSVERIRQLEQQALKRLRTVLGQAMSC